MDEIETGFTRIMEKIEEMKKKDAPLAETVRKHDAEMLGRMAVMAKPVVESVGLDLLMSGKQDTKNELYDTRYYPDKMIILGKAEPAPVPARRPVKEDLRPVLCPLRQGSVFRTDVQQRRLFHGLVSQPHRPEDRP